jgi:hypothetical protein
MDSDIEGLIRKLWEDAFNGRELDVLDGVTAPKFVNRNALPGTPPGPEGHRQVVERLWKAFPDAHFEIEHLASDGDTVVCIGTMSGDPRGKAAWSPSHRQKGRMAPMPPISFRRERPCDRTRRDPRRREPAPPVRATRELALAAPVRRVRWTGDSRGPRSWVAETGYDFDHGAGCAEL